mgnify:CR=1 FL=1
MLKLFLLPLAVVALLCVPFIIMAKRIRSGRSPKGAFIAIFVRLPELWDSVSLFRSAVLYRQLLTRAVSCGAFYRRRSGLSCSCSCRRTCLYRFGYCRCSRRSGGNWRSFRGS